MYDTSIKEDISKITEAHSSLSSTVTQSYGVWRFVSYLWTFFVAKNPVCDFHN